ncbi:MAG: OadG family protein [Bacteroidales bacterium]|nr:OadG family protein [Bacteroidales bacterium]
MNKLKKILLPGVLALAAVAVSAQPPAGEAAPHAGCPMHNSVPAVEFQSTKMCFAPMLRAFVAIDSIECSVHVVDAVDGRMRTAATFQTDDIHKRHDLAKILRPVSVGSVGPYVAVLASSKTDSAYLALLDADLNVVARRGFSCPMYAMHFEHGQVMVVGRNQYGYDIEVLPLRDGLDAFEHAPSLASHYRVAKQAEKIKETDPVGIGLTAVAVAVVFLALVCIALILQGSGKLIAGLGSRKPKEGKTEAAPTAAGDEAEVAAAIAAAIHLYNDELHDEEDAVITIQKVERDWTPWNAKYYNMNHYFSNRR